MKKGDKRVLVLANYNPAFIGLKFVCISGLTCPLPNRYQRVAQMVAELSAGTEQVHQHVIFQPQIVDFSTMARLLLIWLVHHPLLFRIACQLSSTHFMFTFNTFDYNNGIHTWSRFQKTASAILVRCVI